MSYRTKSVLVVSSARDSLLTHERAREIVRAYDFESGGGCVEVDVLSAEAPELALWLDHHLAWSAMIELLTPGCSPTVVLVEDGKGSHGAGQAQRAIDHVRSFNRDWLTVVHRAPDGTWEYRG
ncbi:hypothetical protein EKK58_00130 [Candidatus Dependentiae bacterium]|nr:MAG: hypothetical protein EKK58_00130 [Candidatus Dependentiae bacterium]